jgi:tetrahydromethanopterin S-methyltransferase subunit E
MRGHDAADYGEAIAGIVFFLLVFVAPAAAWLTHVVVCLKAASWGFLIAGAIFFPIGIIHGVGLWFGWF